MPTEGYTDYKLTTLQPLIDRLEAEHYDRIQSICDAANRQANKLKELEVQQATSHYIALCLSLIDEVTAFIKLRKEVIVPYVATLHGKKETGHDCTHCSGGCNLQHELKLTELQSSHAGLKDVLHRLQMVALPLYSETLYPDAYRVLRNQMALIENGLMELYYAEEAYLIPKVTEAQKSINARN